MSSSSDLTPVRPARWPWVLFGVFVCITLLSLVVEGVREGSIADDIPYVLAFLMFGVVGALILSRDRRNVIGGLLLWGAGAAVSLFATGVIMGVLVEGGGRSGFLVSAVAIVANVGWPLGLLPVLFLLPLLFPDGRLPSPRWKPFLWAIVVSLALISLSIVFGEERLTGNTDEIWVTNPLFLPAVESAIGWFADAGFVFLILLAGSVLSLVVRFHRAGGVERQQIKWVAFAMLVMFLTLLTSELFIPSDALLLDAVVSGAAFFLLPLTIGLAVLRYRLYDLDVVVRKTVVYALLAIFASAVYLAIVVGAGAWLGRESSFLTMLAAVIVAVTFQPVRARVTRFANRLVYGRRASPYEVLAEFSERVGGAYADEDVLPRMARVLGEGIGGERADVWLAVDHELRDVAAWPADADGRPAIPLANGSVPPIEGMDRVYPVEQGGELLGALAVRKPTSDPVTPADEKLIADLASQAGLVLRNVRLSEALRARLDELKAAQKRLVSAQDAERRRLERNIHDGAQQQLVALAVKLKLADGLIERDAQKARELVGQLQGETHAALEDLRDLARGIYPPLLADKGLAAAIEAQARKSGLPVEVRVDGIGRYPQDIEAAVYFSVLEALQNVAKYASASSVTVSLSERALELVFAVVDDGRGFDSDDERRRLRLRHPGHRGSAGGAGRPAHGDVGTGSRYDASRVVSRCRSA